MGTWLIWSNEHRAWWRPGGAGYTFRVQEAGRYGFAEARKICDDACGPSSWTKNLGEREPDEVMVPSPEMLAATEAMLFAKTQAQASVAVGGE